MVDEVSCFDGSVGFGEVPEEGEEGGTRSAEPPSIVCFVHTFSGAGPIAEVLVSTGLGVSVGFLRS